MLQNRCYKHRTKHEHALEKIGPAYSREAAEEGIAYDDNCCKIHGNLWIHSYYSVEKSTTCLYARCRINSVCNQNTIAQITCSASDLDRNLLVRYCGMVMESFATIENFLSLGASSSQLIV